ncbi:serine protease [Streptomyces sp. I05A-00742]|uniref:serine protease n=1 Tax=Streptomyces sp. I05A-00742 TaxID=2732853 RepID=UPI002016D303|nr:serine protease [Streptomyces sp. I05A-00742]
MSGRRTDADESLVRIRDLAGRRRGTGFPVDDRSTLITSHEAVDGLACLVLHAAGDRTVVVGADAVTPLPECDLALVRTEGLDLPPLAVAATEDIEDGTRVRLRAGRWHDAAIVGEPVVTYTATDRFHLLRTALELSLPERTPLRLGEEATGGPVLDADTGAVLGVLGTALHAERRAGGYAIPLRATAAADPDGPLAALLDRNAATVPAYGRDLNLAGALQLTGTSLGSVVTPRTWRDPVERPETVREFSCFLAGGAAGARVLTRAGEDGTPAGPYVLGLVGEPGTGRTTELGALAARRSRGAEPAPTLWLRGADLRADDESVRDAIARALKAAGRIVTASAGAAGTVGDTSAATPEAVARLAHRVGRPLLVLLDGPEEMPPLLAHALPAWTAATARWLERTGSRLVVACRPEHWETAGALFPPAALHSPATALVSGAPALTAAPPAALPACVRLTGLTPELAERARVSYGIPAGALAVPDGGHPLALRLLAEVRAALPDGADRSEGDTAPDRWDVFAAYLDLVCLRIAVRLAAARRPPLRGTAVRRLAAKVAGQVHEAARQCLGPGQGELERETFEQLFPWRTGWASAVLTEGLLVPAGSGYRFAHEEFADWLHGTHLDLDAALHALVHRWYEPEGPPAEAAVRLPPRRGGGPARAPEGHVPPPPGSRGPTRRRGRRGGGEQQEQPTLLPVPRHRIGPVLQALLLLARRSGPKELSRRLTALVHAVETLSGREGAPAANGDVGADGGAGAGGGAAADECAAANGGAGAADGRPRALTDPAWWAAHLLAEALLRLPDAASQLPVLRLLAERVAACSRAAGGFDSTATHVLGGLTRFGPPFWLQLRLGLADRLDLLRLLVPADGPPPGAAGGAPQPFPTDRFLPATAALLGDNPSTAQSLICRWFDDDHPLLTPADGDGEFAAPTVATAAQALLHTHRKRAVDDLTDALVGAAHPRADELLAALAEDEPSALCRAVDRWAHDDRVELHVAAAAYGLKAVPHVTTEADRELLRYSALALLSRPAEGALHGTALAVLVRDPLTRAKHLPEAVARFSAGDPQVPASALAAALTTHPEPVLGAFRARLYQPGDGPADVLRILAEVGNPALARRAASLVREHVEHRPESAPHVAAFVDRRLEDGPSARAVLFPLVTHLLRTRPAQVRRALVPVLAAPGTAASRGLRRELLDVLLEREQQEPYERGGTVLDALLRAVAECASERAEARTRDLVLLTGQLMVRTAEGAACFDRRLVQLAREIPAFGARVRRWLRTAPAQWAPLVGPGARIRLTAGGGADGPGAPADADRRQPAWHS